MVLQVTKFYIEFIWVTFENLCSLEIVFTLLKPSRFRLEYFWLRKLRFS